MKKGCLVISLDFELAWGVQDAKSLINYQSNLAGVRQVIPRLLEQFKIHNVHATFATVGMLFFHDKKELLAHLPDRIPGYTNSSLSSYIYLSKVENSAENALIHFAPDLIDEIKMQAGMEIATHTFSHYYCMEQGQTVTDFHSDLNAAIIAANLKGVKLKSIVFPRNQINVEYLEICREAGISCYRGNENSWLHPGDYSGNSNLIRRLLRLADTYFNLTGQHVHEFSGMCKNGMYNIPSSRFLKPHHPSLKWLDQWKLKRITSAMTHAAKTGTLFHLWWHPHNFGIHMDENIEFLEKILAHYDLLKATYGFRSMNMGEVAQLISRH